MTSTHGTLLGLGARPHGPGPGRGAARPAGHARPARTPSAAPSSCSRRSLTTTRRLRRSGLRLLQPDQPARRRQLHADQGQAVRPRLRRVEARRRLYDPPGLRLCEPELVRHLPGGLLPGCKLGTEGGQDLHAARVALRWLPNDNIENNLIASVTADRSEVPALKLLYSNNTQNSQRAAIIPGGAAVHHRADVVHDYATYVRSRASRIRRSTTVSRAPARMPRCRYPRPTRPIITVSPTRSPGSSRNYSLTAITGYLRYQRASRARSGTRPTPPSLLRDTWSERQFTEEIRLNGTSFGMLDWTVGGLLL